MKSLLKQKISVMLMVLVFFLSMTNVYAFILTETVYTPAEEDVDLRPSAHVYSGDCSALSEEASFVFGLLDDLSLGVSVPLYHPDVSDYKNAETGDIFLKTLYYSGDFFDDFLHLACLLEFTFPSGRNSYKSSKLRPYVFGNNEIKTGLVARMDFPGRISVHANLFYLFRQSDSGGFYEGFNLNPVKSNTWTSVFGLNPFSDGAFLDYSNLENDYMIFAFGINTDLFYPVMPSLEMLFARGFTAEDSEDEIPLSGYGINPFVISAGVRYFFTGDFFAGLNSSVNLIRSHYSCFLHFELEAGFVF